jgi:hypothetical protein
MIQEASQSMPQRQGVVAGFGQSALWQSLATGGLDLVFDRFQDRARLLLAQLVPLSQAEMLLSSLCINAEEHINGACVDFAARSPSRHHEHATFVTDWALPTMKSR